ncbi:FAD-binding oxidoreductase [Aliidiomarina sedimenti]|uniref:FAD-binding oxidoreductase n=1 Tax=Aliidiomarina sedimenti TaxID=1933879 RepID=A0ABY0BYG0_9GAMM|nr:FAD-dependent oxidoreductase [Aliidiomarina sedimenti]RUO29796.1 FAD-binding oxidoreductase [Aliidiomarina sedimenti]
MASPYAVYDPLCSPTTPRNHDRDISSYWQHNGPLTGAPGSTGIPCSRLPQHAEFVVVGAGYTGLNAAIELSQRGHQVVVLEAGDVAAGCSSRNAGFVLPSSGRLSLHDYRRHYGAECADNVLHEFNQGVRHVESLVKAHQIECDWQSASYVRVAHTPAHAAALRALADNAAAWPRRYLDSAHMQQRYGGLRHAHGALQQQPAARVHPRALAQGYATIALQAGSQIKTSCPVTALSAKRDGYLLQTAEGEIQADKVLMCSNGYLQRSLLPALSHCQLPALSSIIVTAPLSDWQRECIGLTDRELMMDTRLLKYYYRLLPDGRLLFGGRGAVQGRDANHPRYQHALLQAMYTSMPVLKGIAVDYSWCGWISVSADSMPRVCELDTNLFASFGYCGAGISFSSLAGKRLAQRALGDRLAALPFYQLPPRSFPMPRMRRLGQRLYYRYARVRDAW